MLEHQQDVGGYRLLDVADGYLCQARPFEPGHVAGFRLVGVVYSGRSGVIDIFLHPVPAQYGCGVSR